MGVIIHRPIIRYFALIFTKLPPTLKSLSSSTVVYAVFVIQASKPKDSFINICCCKFSQKLDFDMNLDFDSQCTNLTNSTHYTKVLDISIIVHLLANCNINLNCKNDNPPSDNNNYESILLKLRG